MILVTGGAGFIGSALIAELNARGVEDILIIDILGKDGHYILAPCHFLLDDIPAENVLAMHAEALAYQPVWA